MSEISSGSNESIEAHELLERPLASNDSADTYGLNDSDAKEAIVNKMVFTKQARYEVSKAGHTGFVKIAPLIFAAVFIVACIGISLEQNELSPTVLMVTIFGAGLLILFAFFGYILQTMIFLKLHKQEYGAAEVVHVVRFSESGIDRYNALTEKIKTFSYQDISKIILTDGLIILSMRNNSAVVLDRQGFVKGSLDELVVLVEEKNAQNQ